LLNVAIVNHIEINSRSRKKKKKKEQRHEENPHKCGVMIKHLTLKKEKTSHAT